VRNNLTTTSPYRIEPDEAFELLAWWSVPGCENATKVPGRLIINPGQDVVLEIYGAFDTEETHRPSEGYYSRLLGTLISSGRNSLVTLRGVYGTDSHSHSNATERYFARFVCDSFIVGTHDDVDDTQVASIEVEVPGILDWVSQGGLPPPPDGSIEKGYSTPHRELARAERDGVIITLLTKWHASGNMLGAYRQRPSFVAKLSFSPTVSLNLALTHTRSVQTFLGILTGNREQVWFSYCWLLLGSVEEKSCVRYFTNWRNEAETPTLQTYQ